MSGFWERAGRGGPDECWLWSGGKTGAGYGVVTLCGREVAAHRLAWEIVNGAVPPGLFILHRCDVPACCNPSHLFAGTQADNMQDMVSKGRKYRKPGSLHPHAKLDEARVIDIRERRSNGARTRDLARDFGVSLSTISGILHRATWVHV